MLHRPPLTLKRIDNTRKKTCSMYAEQLVRRYPEFFIQERDAVVPRLFSSQEPLAHRRLIYAQNIGEFLLAQIFFVHQLAQYVGIRQGIHAFILCAFRSKVLT